MFKSGLLAVSTFTMLAITATAQQQPIVIDNAVAGASNRYFNMFGGYTLLHDYSGEQGPVTLTGTFRDGWMMGSAVGRQLNPNLRVEVDGSFRQNSGDIWTGLASVPFDGRIRNYSTMFNMLRDFGNGQVRPYVGGGIGIGYSDGDFLVGATPFNVSDAAFAYQAIAGVSVTTANGMEFFSEYRFYGNTAVPLTNTVAATSDDFAYLSQNGVFGIRIRR